SAMPAFAQATLSITQIDPSGFPYEIDTFVRLVDNNGEAILGMGRDDFTVHEDGILAYIYDVIPATESGEGINWALVIDTSGSMVGDRLAATKQAAHAFIDSMRIRDKAAIIRFSDVAVVVQGLTQYKSLLHNAVNSLEADGVTALYDGFYLGLTELVTATRPRALIALSDGNDSGVSEHTLEEIIAIAGQDSLGIPCYTIGLVVPDPTVLQIIAASTQAEYIDVADPAQLPDIYQQISQSIRSQYQITFYTPNPEFDGTTRTVRVTYNEFPYPWDEVQYTVDQAPIIIRTPETIALSETPQQPGTYFDIQAEITDNTQVVGAWLYYRTTPAFGLTGLPYSNPQQMEYLGDDLFQGVIPSEISDPYGATAYGVDYYLEASDGRLTTQSPSFDPQAFPWQIPIYPNDFPQLIHEPVTEAGVGFS
ncbi:MAG: VWA domain-containing protein, partial [Planctomycetes bacterium]|nr:VWA domain-containing protein [Planctomycetota bacterium]